MRRPAPGQEAIAAALQAIQKVAANSDTEEALAAEARAEPTERAVCASCGGDNPARISFARSVAFLAAGCNSIGANEGGCRRFENFRPETCVCSGAQCAGQHYYHHHYHHHYFSPASEVSPIPGGRRARSSKQRCARYQGAFATGHFLIEQGGVGSPKDDTGLGVCL